MEEAPRRPILCRVVLLTLALALAGCGPTKHQTTPVPKREKRKPIPLRVLVIDDSELAAAVKRHWQARSGGDVRLKELTSEQLLAWETSATARRLNADVVIYPSVWLGQLAESSLISPISAEQERDRLLNLSGFLPQVRRSEIVWGAKIYAVSLGSPQLVLLYRHDIFEEHELTPPATWQEYEILEKRLRTARPRDEESGKSSKWYGTLEPVASGWGGALLLQRAAAYARHPGQFSTLFDLRSMEPLIASPAFVRALEELVAVMQSKPVQFENWTPSRVRKEFLHGNTAMAICWPTRFVNSSEAEPGQAESEPGDSVATGFAQMPGSSDVYNFRSAAWEQREPGSENRVSVLGISGRLGSVTRECRSPADAHRFLFWMSSDELSVEVSPVSRHTAPFRLSHLRSAGMWVGREFAGQASRSYGEIVGTSFGRDHSFSAIRIPGQARYHAALDRAVADALSGSLSAQQSLETAARQWQQITEEIGVDRQRSSYARSIGIEP